MNVSTAARMRLTSVTLLNVMFVDAMTKDEPFCGSDTVIPV
jgi:hypothetical protein